MEFYQIRYFVATAETLNFTRAAENCGVSQPSLTKGIQKLEEELGGPLFRREGRRTHLTDLGRLVRPRLTEALSLTKIAREEALDFSQLEKAVLKLGCMCTISPRLIAPLIENLCRDEGRVRVTLQEDTGQQLTQRMMDGDLDICLMALPSYPDELTATTVYSEPYVIAFPAGHRFGEMNAVPVAEVTGEPYLERVDCEYMAHFEAAGRAGDIDVDVRFESSHENWVREMVIAGLGCSIMPESLATNPKLHSRPLTDPSLRRTISVVTRRGRRHQPVVECFLRLCNRMRARQSGTDSAGAMP